MSVDLYFILLHPRASFDDAMELIEQLEAGNDRRAKGKVDARLTAQTIMRLEPRYKVFEKDYAEIAQLTNITEEQARATYDYVELNAESDTGEPMAQFTFHRNLIVVHWYSGTDVDEMDKFVRTLCALTKFALVDPQASEVYRLQPDGSVE